MKRNKIKIQYVVEEFKDSQENEYNKKFFLEDMLAKFSNRLSKGQEGDIGVAADNLYCHIEFNAKRGILDILDGNMDGWKAVKRLLQYESWYFQYNCKRHEQLPRLHQIYRSNNATLCFAHLIIHEDYELAKWYGGRLEKNFTNQLMGNWVDTPFEPFMVCLYHLWQSLPLMQGLPENIDLDIYQDILDYWNGPEDKFRASLVEACQYHMDRIDDPDSEYKEFCWSPYSLFPVEILAILKVRKLLGLSVPTVDHELMRLPTAMPPYPMPGVEDELFEKVKLAAQKYVPLDFGNEELSSSLGGKIKGIIKKLKK